jgi:hypothetical protein
MYLVFVPGCLQNFLFIAAQRSTRSDCVCMCVSLFYFEIVIDAEEAVNIEHPSHNTYVVHI